MNNWYTQDNLLITSVMSLLTKISFFHRINIDNQIAISTLNINFLIFIYIVHFLTCIFNACGLIILNQSNFVVFIITILIFTSLSDITEILYHCFLLNYIYRNQRNHNDEITRDELYEFNNKFFNNIKGLIIIDSTLRYTGIIFQFVTLIIFSPLILSMLILNQSNTKNIVLQPLLISVNISITLILIAIILSTIIIKIASCFKNCIGKINRYNRITIN